MLWVIALPFPRGGRGARGHRIPRPVDDKYPPRLCTGAVGGDGDGIRVRGRDADLGQLAGERRSQSWRRLLADVTGLDVFSGTFPWSALRACRFCFFCFSLAANARSDAFSATPLCSSAGRDAIHALSASFVARCVLIFAASAASENRLRRRSATGKPSLLARARVGCSSVLIAVPAAGQGKCCARRSSMSFSSAPGSGCLGWAVAIPATGVWGKAIPYPYT